MYRMIIYERLSVRPACRPRVQLEAATDMRSIRHMSDIRLCKPCTAIVLLTVVDSYQSVMVVLIVVICG